MTKIKWSDICESSREIDKLIAIHVFDRDVFTYDDKLCSGYCFESLKLPSGKIMVDWIPHYSEDIADAWDVVDKLDNYTIDTNVKMKIYSVVCMGRDNEIITSTEETAPLAICHAALVAEGIVE